MGCVHRTERWPAEHILTARLETTIPGIGFTDTPSDTLRVYSPFAGPQIIALSAGPAAEHHSGGTRSTVKLGVRRALS